MPLNIEARTLETLTRILLACHSDRLRLWQQCRLHPHSAEKGCLSAFHDRHTGKQNCVQLPLYEDIIADPESGIREILQFINWEYDPFGHGKWESYAGHLAPLLAALGQKD